MFENMERGHILLAAIQSMVMDMKLVNLVLIICNLFVLMMHSKSKASEQTWSDDSMQAFFFLPWRYQTFSIGFSFTSIAEPHWSSDDGVMNRIANWGG